MIMTERFAFLHIGKTGGSAIRDVLDRMEKAYGASHIDVFGHRRNIETILQECDERRLFFVVRDPLSRFTSGFYSRKRLGKWGTNEWNDREARMFAAFETPNALAEALSDDDKEVRRLARKSLKGSVHFQFGLSTYLKSVGFLENVKDRIAFIGHLPTLNEDFRSMRLIVGIPDTVELPGDDEVMSHRALTTYDRTLSERGESNIRKYFRAEFPIYEWCLSRRREILERL